MSDVLDRQIAEEAGPVSAVIAREAFDGCGKRVEIATFLGTFAAEQRVRGMLLGLVAGIAGTVTVGLLLHGKYGGK